MTRAQELIARYGLQRHPEGGWFAEDYTCRWEKDGRPLAGSIFFLLDGAELSHFHQIDCDELWYFHEGCGLKITMLLDGRKSELLLGLGPGERACVLLPAGSVFAAENLDKTGCTFLSCATAPAFRYEGFRLVYPGELEELIPEEARALRYLAMEEDAT
jgi:predicted cupin superfamily sugar epimerase